MVPGEQKIKANEENVEDRNRSKRKSRNNREHGNLNLSWLNKGITIQ